MRRLGLLACFAVFVAACSPAPTTDNRPADNAPAEDSDEASADVICASATILLEALREDLAQEIAPDAPIDVETAERKAGIIALAGQDVLKRHGGRNKPRVT